jgi:NDP-sugar pyrophosphorylase family protein
MGKAKKIDWIICAAGTGSRFKDYGINKPKPSIQLLGITFLERSISCLDMLPGDQVLLITQKNQVSSKLLKKIKNAYPWIKFKLIELSKPTSGQLTTFLKAEPYLRKTASLVIWNCDTYFKSTKLSELLRYGKFDGVVPCGKLAGNRWSFFKTNKDGIIIDAKEKERISPWCSVGFYQFEDSQEIIKLANKITKSKPNKKLKEHYVSSLYPLLIKKGKKLINCPVDLFMPFGTVKDVEKYWNIKLSDLKRENIEE